MICVRCLRVFLFTADLVRVWLSPLFHTLLVLAQRCRLKSQTQYRLGDHVHIDTGMDWNRDLLVKELKM